MNYINEQKKEKLRSVVKSDAQLVYLEKNVERVMQRHRVQYVNTLKQYEENEEFEITNLNLIGECMVKEGCDHYKILNEQIYGYRNKNVQKHWSKKKQYIFGDYAGAGSNIFKSYVENFGIDTREQSNRLVEGFNAFCNKRFIRIEELDEFVFERCFEVFKTTKNLNRVAALVNMLIDYESGTIKRELTTEEQKERIEKAKQEQLKKEKKINVDIDFKELEEERDVKSYKYTAEVYATEETQLLKDLKEHKKELNNEEYKRKINLEKYFLKNTDDIIAVDRVRSIFISKTKQNFKYHKCWFIELKNENNITTGYGVRFFDEEYVKNGKYKTYRDYSIGMQKTNVYNLNKVINKENGEVKKIFVMEGVFKAKLLQDIFETNKEFEGFYAIATHGITLNLYLYYLLNKYIDKKTEIVAFYDNDASGIYANYKFILRMHRYKFTNLKIIKKSKYFQEKDENDLFKNLYIKNNENYEKAELEFVNIIKEIVKDLEGRKGRTTLPTQKQLWKLLNSGYEENQIARLLTLDNNEFAQLRKQIFEDVTVEFNGRVIKWNSDGFNSITLELNCLMNGNPRIKQITETLMVDYIREKKKQKELETIKFEHIKEFKDVFDLGEFEPVKYEEKELNDVFDLEEYKPAKKINLEEFEPIEFDF